MKKTVKNVLSMSLAVSMLFSMAGCGKKNDSSSTETTNTETSASDVNEVSDRTQADWVDKAVIYEVNLRQYTSEGTIKAFSEHLQRLKDMGVNTLWFMPIYSISQVNKKGTLGSYYSIQDYKTVNSEFGTNEDFKNLVDTAHSMGFSVVLDWVANHTGFDHTWITEHPDYYLKDENGEIMSPLNTDWTDVAQLDFSNPDMRAAMIDAMKYWVTDMGVDGFRCDYAHAVPLDFWETARAELDSIKPIFMVAEDGLTSDSLLNKAFDSDYNFAMYDAMKLSASLKNKADDISKFLDPKVPAGSFRMNFLDNHDKNTYDGTMEERFSNDALNALTTIIFTAKGLPLIYSGDEEDSNISLEFFEKDNIDFGDYKYGELFTALSKIKQSYTALDNISGGKVEVLKEDNKNVIAYKRAKDGKQITVVLNISDAKQSVSYDKKMPSGTVILHGKGTELDTSENKLTVKDLNNLEPWEFYIIESDI